MLKKNLLNLLLFVIVISLAALIYFSEEESYELDRLTGIDIGDITEISIRHNENKTTIRKQEDDSWLIIQPVTIAANNFRLNSILELINAPVHSNYQAADIDTRSFGLQEPTTTIQFDVYETAYRIDFGITNPSTNLRYIQLNDVIYTIEDAYYPLLSSHFGTLVSLNLLPANSKIEKLVLPELTLSKNNNGLWQSDNDDIKLSADNIVTIIDDWQQTQAFGIHAYMERKGLGEIKVYLEGHEQAIAFRITDTDPWLILVRPDLGLEYHLDIKAYDKLIKPQD